MKVQDISQEDFDLLIAVLSKMVSTTENYVNVVNSGLDLVQEGKLTFNEIHKDIEGLSFNMHQSLDKTKNIIQILEEGEDSVDSKELENDVYVFCELKDDSNSLSDVDQIKLSDGVSIGKENALKSAKEYLHIRSFSRSGLIDKLIRKGYTKEEAIYGVDNCGADWYSEAVKLAKEYLNTRSFSRSGLIDKLIRKGFTSDQAEHGVSVVYI